MTKAQIHSPSENSNKQNFIAFSDNSSLSQERNLNSEIQNSANFEQRDYAVIVLSSILDNKTAAPITIHSVPPIPNKSIASIINDLGCKDR